MPREYVKPKAQKGAPINMGRDLKANAQGKSLSNPPSNRHVVPSKAGAPKRFVATEGGAPKMAKGGKLPKAGC